MCTSSSLIVSNPYLFQLVEVRESVWQSWYVVIGRVLQLYAGTPVRPFSGDDQSGDVEDINESRKTTKACKQKDRSWALARHWNHVVVKLVFSLAFLTTCWSFRGVHYPHSMGLYHIGEQGQADRANKVWRLDHCSWFSNTTHTFTSHTHHYTSPL